MSPIKINTAAIILAEKVALEKIRGSIRFFGSGGMLGTRGFGKDDG